MATKKLAMTTGKLGQRYTEIESVGEGGMASIVKVKDVDLGREVAIKRPLPNQEDEADSQQRFLAEARATGQLEHANIPPIYEMGKDEDGQPYLSLKLVKGRSLRQLIDELDKGTGSLHDQYRFPHRLEVFQKVCEAVAYAHQKGILHRDIKPDNIMVGEYGEVFLLDWGLAAMHSATPVKNVESSEFSGTPTYAAPDQLRGQPATPLSDVYSLGATLYEWMSLRPPHEGDNLSRILTSVMTKEPADPARLSHPSQDKVPVEIARVIRKAMSKEPEQRYPSVEPMLSALRDILDGEIMPICACTTIKFGFHEVVRKIDNYPILAAFVLFWLAYPLFSIAYLAWSWFSAAYG